MTASEFQLWLEGYMEGAGKPERPSKKQWARIQDKLAETHNGPGFYGYPWRFYPNAISDFTISIDNNPLPVETIYYNADNALIEVS